MNDYPAEPTELTHHIIEVARRYALLATPHANREKMMSNQHEASATLQWHTSAFSDAVQQVSARARAVLEPTLHARLERATALVLTGQVWRDENGETYVHSETDNVWYRVNGHCECEDYARAPSNICKHRLAKRIYISAHDLIHTDEPGEPLPQPICTPEARLPPPRHIAAEHLVLIQGKPYIKFSGLLALAHAEGLMELQAAWTYNDETTSLAHAVAIFEDGKRFEESGDASPANVLKKIAPHFRRVALTRAKARALRDALNIADLCSVEELGEGE